MLIDSNKLIEAIKEHANNCAEGEGVIDQAYKLAHYHIIELVNLLALRAEAESKADSAGDLISREALKKKAETITLWNGDVRRFVSYETIDNAPTVCGNNPKWCESCVSKGKCASTRPQGEWIEVDIKPMPYGAYTCKRKCNKCNYVTSEYRPNFCPNCGARMRGDET